MDSVTPSRGREPQSRHLLEAHVERIGGRGFVEASGDLDLATAPRLVAAVTGLIAAGAVEIVFDGRNLTFVDSAGLHAIVAARRAALDAGASFVVSGASVALRRIIELAGLTSAFGDPSAN